MDSVTTEEGATPPPLSFDPTDGTITPWIWMPMTTLILLCLLFISFRRAKSIELYHKGIEYLKRKLPSSLPFLNSSRGIHLPHPSSNTSPSSSRRPPNFPRSTSFSSDSSSDENLPQLNTDELPLYSNSGNNTPTSLRIASFQRRGQSMLESFSEQFVDGTRRVIGGLGWSEGGGVGVKRMLLGSRDVDKGMGRIRLGEEGGRAVFELDDEEGANEDAVEIPSTNRYT